MKTKRVHPSHPSEQLSEFAAYDTPGGHRVLVMPGLSIMGRHWLSADVVVVRCPGCGASRLYSCATVPVAFVHEHDDCPIRLRIAAALATFRALAEATASDTD